MSFIRGPRRGLQRAALPSPALSRNCVFDDSISGEPKTPANIEDLAFATVLELANLIYRRKITSLALTQMFIARLKRYDPNCTSSSRSPKSARWRRPGPRTRIWRMASIAGRSTAFPGAQKTCSP